MSKTFINAVFRSYIALARGESFAPSEIGDCLEIGDDAFPKCQTNYFADEKVESEIERLWQRDATLQFKAGVFANPGRLANRLICAKLEKVYGHLHEKVPHFDKDNLLHIPRSADFIVPRRNGRFIYKLAFYKIGKRIEKI